MKMREAYEALREMAEGQPFSATYVMSSYGALCCHVYLAKDSRVIYANTWEEALEKLKRERISPLPDEEGEERGCPANLEARG